MATNSYGFFCEEMIRDLLPEIGIPFKWASYYEDRVLGVDCRLTIDGREFLVDFTVISTRELIGPKTEKALKRGVIPVFLEQGTLNKAIVGNERALEELDREIRCQVALKAPMVSQPVRSGVLVPAGV